MRINKNVVKKTNNRNVNASVRRARTHKVVAEDEIVEDVPVEDVPVEEDAVVEVDPAATELVFEAEDVAELIAEVTGEAVEVTVDDDQVVFAVADQEFTVTPEGDEEILESSRKVLRNKKSVKASVANRKAPVAAKRPAPRRIHR